MESRAEAVRKRDVVWSQIEAATYGDYTTGGHSRTRNMADLHRELERLERVIAYHDNPSTGSPGVAFARFSR